MFSTPAPFALSLSKGKRGVFQHPVRLDFSHHSPSPNKGEQLVRYYGYYSNVSRGKKKNLNPKGEGTSWKPEVIEVTPPPISKEMKKRWSYFIQKVYETDPLVCPKCSGQMRIISFIGQRDFIRKILEHLGLWEETHARRIATPPEERSPSIFLTVR